MMNRILVPMMALVCALCAAVAPAQDAVAKKPGAANDTAEIELYDYEVDPLEKTNVAQQQPEVVKELLVLLDKHGEARPQFKQNDRQALFARKDANQDGKLSEEEFVSQGK